MQVPPWVREESLDRLVGDSPDWTDRGTADGNSVQPDSDFGECLGVFAKLCKATISFVMSVPLSVCLSVHPSVPMEQLCSHWMDFHEI
jgi:hypothetical protein